MEIAVIGLGPMGLAACKYLQSRNIPYKCYDKREEALLDIDDAYNIKDYEQADINIICVGTQTPNNGTTMDNIVSVLNIIYGEYAHDDYNIPTTFIRSTLAENYTHWWENIYYMPMFNTEDRLQEEWERPNKLVVGVAPRDADNSITENLYKALRVLFTDLRTLRIVDSNDAILTKYAHNAFLSTKIVFINEMAAIAEQTGASINRVEELLATDPRFGSRIFSGLPHGGTCLPKDLKQLVKTATQLGLIDNIYAIEYAKNRLTSTSAIPISPYER